MRWEIGVKAIRLESFRALVDTGFVSLRPLTVLVGKNSSGKSSFLRFLPLLRQSVEARTTGPIQWYGDYVDFGGFDETLSSSSDDKAIRFGFRLTLDPHSLRRRLGSAYLYGPKRRKTDTLRPVSCELTLTIVPDPKDNSVTRFRSIALEAGGHSINIDMEGPGRLGRVLINGGTPLADVHDELIARSGRLLPLIHRQGRAARAAEADFRYRGPIYPRLLAYPELKEALRPLFHGNTSERKISEAALVIPFGTAEEILLHMRRHEDRGVRWRESVRELSLSSLRFRHIQDLVVANWLGGLVQALDSDLWAFAAGVRYIKPVRATAERYYRQQDLAVDEIDPEGRNLAVFLRSLTETERRDFERWTFKELGWTIVTRLAGGHISLRIRKGTARSYNLTDVGFGFSQVLPVLAQLWFMQRNPLRHRRRLGNQLTFAIEQPELHLHPALQARLADVLARAIASAHRKRVGLTVVVETHSEAIVNRIGHQIASGHIGAKQAAVVLFDASGDAGGTDVQIATFDDRGFLANWPFGFFEPD